MLRNPMVWAGTLLAVVAIAVLLVGRASDRPELRDATTLSVTVGDVVDRAPGASSTVGDIVDDPVIDETGTELSGVPVFDAEARCAWLVGVPGTDSGLRYLVGWPSGTQIAWDPFRVLLPAPSPDDVVLPSDRVIGDGEIHGDLAEIPDADRSRLLGLEDCPHEAVLLFDDRAGNVRVAAG